MGVASAGPQPDPAAHTLAPGPVEWDVALREAEARLDRAEALAVAAQRLQNAWAALLRQAPNPCADPSHAPVGARLVPFAEAWRDAVQRARVQVDRVDRLRDQVTVAPLLDDLAADRVTGIRRRVDRQVAAWGEARAWHVRHAGRVEACGAPVAAPGLPDPRPWRAPDDAAVAVLAMPGGTLCPDDLAATGQVTLVGQRACWSAGPCACAPAPVAPGAVLGPP